MSATTMRNGEVLEAFAAAQSIGQRTTTSILAAVAVRRLLRALRPLAEDVGEALNQLAEKHCERDAKGSFIPLPGGGGNKLRDDAREQYHRERRDLAALGDLLREEDAGT
jgi:hypothetical protein